MKSGSLIVSVTVRIIVQSIYSMTFQKENDQNVFHFDVLTHVLSWNIYLRYSVSDYWEGKYEINVNNYLSNNRWSIIVNG